MVLASSPPASCIRFAALPVGVAWRKRTPARFRIRSSARMIVVFPVPGPPVMTMTLLSRAVRRASRCLSASTISIRSWTQATAFPPSILRVSRGETVNHDVGRRFHSAVIPVSIMARSLPDFSILCRRTQPVMTKARPEGSRRRVPPPSMNPALPSVKIQSPCQYPPSLTPPSFRGMSGLVSNTVPSLRAKVKPGSTVKSSA